MIAAMERSIEASEVYVLFASQAALKSYAVNFEIEEARRQKIFGKTKRVLVFPIESGLTFSGLPKWMQQSWIPNAGENPADIARYLTTVLLEPDRGLSIAAPNIVGRGSSLDLVRRLVASYMQKHKATPKVYVFPGLSGIGRRTFAAYYLRNGLSAEANLPYGPQIALSAQAELVDLYRALRAEIDPRISPSKVAEDQAAFARLSQAEQISETFRAMSHFAQLGQAVTIVSAAGFFEDAATPKSWVKPFLAEVPEGQVLILVSNLQFRDEFLEQTGTAVQMRVKELHDDDIRALMIFTANLIGSEDFKVPERLLSSIGGHPDVANAAVRLAAQKGMAILERDPSQLFNIQSSIIGSCVQPDSLSRPERLVLDILSWLPALGSDLVEKIVVDELKVSTDDFNAAIERLILGCLVYANGYRLSIAASVRQLYRRYNVTDKATLIAMAKVFERAWQQTANEGFRDDLLSAFVFMHVLEGKSLPPELRSLLTPSNLYDAVRDAYARGRQNEDETIIRLAIDWGKLAIDMRMGDGLREEILSTVSRAQIRLGLYDDAESTIEIMRKSKYRAVTFLEGYSLRRRRKFDAAIPKLRFVVENNRQNRSAVHELALCYRRLRRWKDLEGLLKTHGDLVGDSSTLLDFTIAVNISRGQLHSVPSAIQRLRQIDDSSVRADIRYAQFLSKRGDDVAAFTYLNDAMSDAGRRSIRLQALRATIATRLGRFKEARDDLRMIQSVDKDGQRSTNIEVHLLLAEKRYKDAYDLVMKTPPQEPSDWLLRGAVLEALANAPDTLAVDSIAMKKEAAEIRAKYGNEISFDDFS